MKKKREIICSIACPHCQKSIDVVKEEELITPAQKAEKEITFFAEKSSQTKLS
jgi:hypothetical protein